MTYNDALRSFSRHEAMLMLSHVTGKSHTEIALNPCSVLDEIQKKNFLTILEKRRDHVPLQYLLERWQFMGLEFNVNPHVLIPRQDTEILVEAAIKALSNGSSANTNGCVVLRNGRISRVLDLCTGSGCIAVSLAIYTDADITASDISPKALETARRNAKINGVGERISFIESDLFENISGKFDMIISNPPYIPSDEIQNLQEEVKSFEPLLALDGGADGMDFYRRIISEAKRFLFPEGMLYLEAGNADGIRSLLSEGGFLNIAILNDLAGLNRVVYGIMPDADKNNKTDRNGEI